MNLIQKESIEKIEDKIEVYAFCVVILLDLFRTVIPFFKYPFVILFFCLFIYTIWKFRSKLLTRSVDFLQNYYLLIGLLLYLIAAFFISNKFYLAAFKDVINSILLLVLFFLLSIKVSDRMNFSLFVSAFLKLTIVFGAVISLYLMFNLFNILYNNPIPAAQVTPFELNDYLIIDYNFAQLPIFFGLFSILYWLIKFYRSSQKILYFVIISFFNVSIFLSGSRRSLIMLIGITLIIAVLVVISLFIKRNRLEHIRKISIYYSISIIIIACISLFLVFNTNFLFKQNLLKSIGSTNIPATKQRVAFNIYRYMSMYSNSIKFQDVYNTIWSASIDFNDADNSSFDPKNPESIWGTRIHQTVYPLEGENVEIVPPGSKGYKMDRTCNATTWDGNAFSFTVVAKGHIEVGDTLMASVFCYVSKDFDGSYAMIYSDDPKYTQQRYDLNNKGQWQKLSISVENYTGEIAICLYFSKSGVTDFSSLNGYVIFAYPLVKVENKIVNRTESTSQSVLNNFKMSRENLENHKVYKSGFLQTGLKLYNPPDSVFKNPSILKYLNFVKEDTTFHNLKTYVTLDTIRNNLLGPRLMRWRFAGLIFLKEYNLRQKLFGNGFDFLNWYGYYFYKDKQRSDYPHNPFLSILLYSGVLGLVLYVILLYKVFYYYLKCSKEYLILFIFFIISFFFSFFSAGSPLDPPLMGFFIILPFFMNSILKKDNTQGSSNS